MSTVHLVQGVWYVETRRVRTAYPTARLAYAEAWRRNGGVGTPPWYGS